MNVRDKYPSRIAKGYVRIRCWEEATGKITYDSFKENTVVNSARESAAAAFANTPGAIGLGFNVKQYRMGYSNVLSSHWDSLNAKPLEAPFTESALLPEYTGVETENYFHTQADVSGLLVDGLQWQGVGSPLAQVALPLGIVYPFNADNFAVELTVDLDATISVGAVFDTVEVVLGNGAKFAHRWVAPITKVAGWGLSCTHLCLF